MMPALHDIANGAFSSIKPLEGQCGILFKMAENLSSYAPNSEHLVNTVILSSVLL